MSTKRWIKFQNSLIGLKTKFEHIKGKDNILADWLSRQIIINNIDNTNDWFYDYNMTQRKPTKARTFQYGTICLNEVLNPNLRFNSLFSQNLFEENKVIVDNFWSLKP